jgi:TPR repeat protein
MPILLKVVAGLVAGVIVGVLTFAFWPQIEPAVVSARPAVERPIFVTNAAEAKPAADKAAIDKLASALRTGAPADAAAPSPTRSLALTPASAANANDAALCLRAQGLVALADGDIAAARAFLERAAEAGDARAILVLGDTYDPATLARLGAVGLKGDASQARDYYARALSAGLAAARNRIAALESQQN